MFSRIMNCIPPDLAPSYSSAVRELAVLLGEAVKDSDAVKEEDKSHSVIVKSSKRLTAISWDNYFMAVAFLSAMRSKDPSTQVGACIVDSRKRIVGIGYNGFPTGCSDDILPWARTAEDELDTKYPYVVHAEVNAILNKISAELIGCSIYVGLFPCNECAKTIIQSGIKEVVYLSDKYARTNSMRASRIMFEMAGVEMRQFYPAKETILVNFESIKS